MADDDLTVVVHEQVEKALRRIFRQAHRVNLAAAAALVIVYSVARDYLEVYLEGNETLATVASAISCRTPLFFIIADVCSFFELHPGNSRTMILLAAVAIMGIVGLLMVAYYTERSLYLVRQAYGYYVVGDIRYTRKRFRWLLVGICIVVLNTVTQAFNAYLRSDDPELAARMFAPTTRFWMTLVSIVTFYWALLEIIQFAVFAGLVSLKRRRAAREATPPSQREA